jgi:hypothetical protein
MFSVSPAYLLLSVQYHRELPSYYAWDALFSQLCRYCHVSQDFNSTTMSEPMPDGTTERVLYAERPEWSDVVAIPQYENIQPLAPIFYSPKCM